jgi:tetratricopeptide (TPR) repeat protein
MLMLGLISVTIMLALLVEGTAYIPFNESAVTNDEPQSILTEAILQKAQQEFGRTKSIDPETLAKLREQKGTVIPIVVGQLGNAASRETLPFWFTVAQAVPDPRIEEAMLTWLKQADPIMLYHRREILDDLKSALNANPSADLTNRLLGLVDGVPSANVKLILRVLNGDNKLDDAVFDRFLKQYGKQQEMYGFIEYLQNTGDWLHLKALYEADSSTTEDVRFVALSALLSGSLAYRGDAEFVSWTRQAALMAYQEKRWKPEQAIDMYLVLHQYDRQAAERLYLSGSSAGYLVPLDGRVEQRLAQMHPQSDLVMGIQAYETIRGQPYFIRPEQNNWYTPEGDDYSNPQQAIPEWQVFLKKYPHHPAADDAAYRLARCEEMTGQYSAALRDFVLSLDSGDRDMSYDSSGMLLYTLDMEMSTKDFIELETDDLPAWMLPWLDYTQSVNLIRDRHYAEAKQALQDFVNKYKDNDGKFFAFLPSRMPQLQREIWQGKSAFWANVSTQLSA